MFDVQHKVQSSTQELSRQSPSSRAHGHGSPPRQILPTSSCLLVFNNLNPSFPITTMGVIRSLINVTALGGAGSLAGWTFWTRNSNFVPLAAADPIFSLPAYAKNNPNRNPTTQDLCVRKVTLSKIKPQLLEKDGKLVEAFCAGVWGGLGELFLTLRRT